MPCADCVNKTAESQKIRRIGGTHCLISHLPLAPRPLPSGFQIPRRFRPQQLRPLTPQDLPAWGQAGRVSTGHCSLGAAPGLPRPPGSVPRSCSSPSPHPLWPRCPLCCPSQLGSHLCHQLGPLLQTLQPRDPAAQAPPPVTASTSKAPSHPPPSVQAAAPSPGFPVPPAAFPPAPRPRWSHKTLRAAPSS